MCQVAISTSSGSVTVISSFDILHRNTVCMLRRITRLYYGEADLKKPTIAVFLGWIISNSKRVFRIESSANQSALNISSFEYSLPLNATFVLNSIFNLRQKFFVRHRINL